MGNDEKLDLILSSMQELKNDMQCMKGKIQELKSDMQEVKKHRYHVSSESKLSG